MTFKKFILTINSISQISFTLLIPTTFILVCGALSKNDTIAATDPSFDGFFEIMLIIFLSLFSIFALFHSVAIIVFKIKKWNVMEIELT